MSQFVVSARKYRPQRFDEVVGQEHVSNTLKNALQNDHLAHAFLFCGPRGVGKTTCARILAKVLNCENRTEDFEACNTCPSCQAFNNNASFNINELDAASNNSVEHIRALIEQVRFQPQQGKYKIFIIDEVHMLSSQAFNAFLKTLEEPPPYAIFILATTEKHKIIPTILSRCQIFDFRRIQVPQMVQHLQHICEQEGINADKDALHIIAQKADGALRDALSIFDRMTSFSKEKIDYQSVIENLNVLDYDYYFSMVDAMLTEDRSAVLLKFDEIFRKGFDPDIFLSGFAEHLRNLLVCKDSETLNLLEAGDALKIRYQQQAKAAPAGFILTALNIASDCDVNYKMARNKRLHVEMAILKMTYIQRAIALKGQPLTLQATPTLEKKTPEITTAPSEVQPDTPATKKNEATPAPILTTANTREDIVKEDASAANTKKDTTETVANAVVTEKLVRKTTKYDMPSLLSLEDEEDDMLEEPVEVELTADLLQKTWDNFIQNIQSPSVKATFQKAAVFVKDKQTIEIEVGSQMAKGMIQQESDLIPFLRKHIPVPELAVAITIDPEKVKDLVVTKKVLSIKEKYEMMRQKNPMVHELRLRLDLKPDNQ